MIPEYEDWPANEDDEFFRDAMKVVLEQALDSNLDYTTEELAKTLIVLMARACVELGAIRQVLDIRLSDGDGRKPWE